MTRFLSASTVSALTLAGLSLTVPAFAQDPAQVQRWFESGRLQQVTEAASPSAPPEVRYLAGQSLLKQNAAGPAAEVFQGLAALPDSDPWHFIGRAAELLIQNQRDEALANAQQAVALNGGLTEAHYQLGLVYSMRNEWAQAAQEFDQASALNPGFAYAYYYAGMAHYRSGRTDRMANRFEQFLRAAPEAPERAAVQQLIRTSQAR